MIAQIERGIPLPPPRDNGRRLAPWWDMQVGDSVCVKTGGFIVAKLHKRARKLGLKCRFTARAVKAGTVRVWRVQ